MPLSTGGVDGAIHRAAGPGLLAECRTLGGCPTGGARITAGYRMKARHVIHTVGPVWRGGARNEPTLLASCYHESLSLAVAKGVCTIACPGVSCGVYGYPIPDAARIAADTVSDFLAGDTMLTEVIFACFTADISQTFRRAMAGRGGLQQ